MSISAEAAQHQRAGRHDLLGYDIAAPIEPDISEAVALHASPQSNLKVNLKVSARSHGDTGLARVPSMGDLVET
jgi:hypothetical protein